jgi:hypothetical protein
VPGFDFGDPGVDLRRLAGQLFGREKESAAESPPDSPPSAPAAEVLPATAENHDLLKVSPEAARVTTQDHVAVQHGPEESDGSHAMREDEEPAPVRRRHGGALPS